MNKIKIFLPVFLLVVVGMFALSSCEKEEVMPNSNLEKNEEAEVALLIPTNVVQKDEINTGVPADSNRELICKIVAKSLLNKDFRGFIKQQAELQLDGDYDIIYNNTKDVEVVAGKTLEIFLYQSYINEQGYSKTIDDFEVLIGSVPNFQISVPQNSEKWSSLREIPLVTFIPKEFDEQKDKYVKAFDYNGNIYWLSTKTQPDVPVVVIGSNERINTDFFSSDIFQNIPDVQNPKANRVSGMKEIMKKVKFTNLSYYETWLQGKPELQLTIFSYDKTKLKTWTTTPKRSEVNNKFKDYNSNLLRWYHDSYGDFLIYCWVELDGGGTTTETYTYKDPNTGLTTTITTTGKKRDDQIGCSPVHKNDPDNEEYDLGMFIWAETFSN